MPMRAGTRRARRRPPRRPGSSRSHDYAGLDASSWRAGAGASSARLATIWSGTAGVVVDLQSLDRVHVRDVPPRLELRVGVDAVDQDAELFAGAAARGCAGARSPARAAAASRARLLARRAPRSGLGLRVELAIATGAYTGPRDLGPLRPSRRRASGSARRVRRAVVRPELDDTAVLEDDDQVGAADGGEPVGDDERRPPRQKPACSATSMRCSVPMSTLEVASSRMRMRGRQAAPVRRRRAGAGRVRAGCRARRPASRSRPRAGGQVQHRPRGRGGDFLVRRQRAERDVLGHGPGEEEAFLRHDAQLPAEAFLGHVLEVVAVDRDPALARVVKAARSFAMVDLPAPVCPTSATVVPAGTARSMPWRISGPSP